MEAALQSPASNKVVDHQDDEQSPRDSCSANSGSGDEDASRPEVATWQQNSMAVD